MEKGKLGPYQLMITSKYFEDINDFKYLELSTKKAKDNMEKFHFNPIPLTKDTIHHFSSLETLHIYQRGDEEFRERKFYKRIIHYLVTYNEMKTMEKSEEDEYLEIELDEKSSQYMNEIPFGVTRIGEKAFCWRNDITHIEIPSSVSSIDYFALFGCDSLTSIVISQQWKIEGDRMVYNRSCFSSFKIPKSVQQ